MISEYTFISNTHLTPFLVFLFLSLSSYYIIYVSHLSLFSSIPISLKVSNITWGVQKSLYMRCPSGIGQSSGSHGFYNFFKCQTSQRQPQTLRVLFINYNSMQLEFTRNFQFFFQSIFDSVVLFSIFFYLFLIAVAKYVKKSKKKRKSREANK